MSNQPLSIGAKFASLGSNARMLTGVAGLAVGALTAGAAVTVASGGNEPSPATAEAEAPAPTDGNPTDDNPATEGNPATDDSPNAASPTPTTAESQSPPTAPPPTTPAPPATTPADTTAPASPAPDTASPITAPADEIDEPDVEGTPGEALPGDGGGEPDFGPEGDTNESDHEVPLDPTGNDQPVDPCDTIADPQQLFALQAVTTMPSGTFTGHITVLNCSPAPLPVEIAAANGMTFDNEDVNLPVGTSTHTFSVDENKVDVGAFDFKYGIFQVGCCTDYAHVHGFKQGFNPDYHNADLGLTAGPGEGGCKAGCITSAWIEGNQLNTSVKLNVGTNVDAVIDAFVSTQAPVPNQAGDPSMPGLTPALSSGGATNSLNGTIGGLQEHTSYYLLVRAVDDNGTSTFVGEFTTIEPLEHPDQFGGNDPNPGCSAGCIVHAMVSDIGIDTADLTVKTSLPATIETWLSTTPIDETGQTPTAIAPAHHFNTPADWQNWELDMNGLADDTTYHVLVRATDENGKADHQIGSFTTQKAPPTPVRVSVDRIDVTDSGDVIGRGEVQFAFEYDDVIVGRISEQKLKDSATLYPADHNFVTTALDDDDRLARFVTWGGERDAVVFAHFCEAPHNDLACSGINWASASGGNHTLAEIRDLPTCNTMGFEGAAADDHCEQIWATDEAGDDVNFKVFIRYDIG